MMLSNIAGALPNIETIKWPSRRILPSYSHGYWRKISKSKDFDPASSVHMAVKAYKKSNFGLLRAMIANVQMFEHLNQLRDNAVERQMGNFCSLIAGDVSAAFETAVKMGNVNEVLAIIMLTNSSVLSTFDLESALVDAAVSNYQDIVHILLKDKNLKSTIMKRKRKSLKENKDLNVALSSACEAGNILDVVSILLTTPGIDLIKNNNLALKNAIDHNHQSIAKLLLSRAEVKNAFDMNNLIMNEIQDLDLALIEACKTGNFDAFLDIIINERVDPSSKKNSALMNAFKYGHDRITKILLHNEKVIQSLHKTVQTVLDIYSGSYEEAYLEACTSGESEIVLALVFTSRSGRLSPEVICKGILVAYLNHNFATARIISRLYGQFDKNGSTNSKLESLCRSGDIMGTVQILASGYVDAALESNRALTVALVAGQNEIAELLMNDKNVSDLAERIKNESLAKNGGDGVKAIVSACGSKSQNTSVVASILLLDGSKPSYIADSALYNALQAFNIESFNILFRSIKISTYLRDVFSTILDDCKKQKDLTQEEFLQSFFTIEHLDKVFAMIQHFFVDENIESNPYSNAFIQKGLLRMDRGIISVLTRIPELQEYIERTISQAFKNSKSNTNTQTFEKSCENGDIIAVCSLLLTSDFIPTLKGLERAVISQNRDVVNLLLQNPIIYAAILTTREKLVIEADGDKQKAFKKAYSSEDGIIDTICLTLIDDPEIDLSENDNEAIRTAFYGQRLGIFMVLAFNEKVVDPLKGIRLEILQSCHDDPSKALIQSCENGEENDFLAIIFIDVMQGKLDPSFDSNLPLKTAYRNGYHKFARILLSFDKVQLLQISEKKKLIEEHGSWKQALKNAARFGQFDDVAILTVGSTVYDDLIDALIVAASLDHVQIIDHLKNLIPFANRLDAFKLKNANGIFTPVGDFHMIRRQYILSDGVSALRYMLTSEFIRIAYLKVRFINTLGAIEGSGIAFGPGPFKEFLQEIWHEALKSEYQLFEGTDDGQVVISRFAKSDEETNEIFYQLGRILGKAVMFGISLDVPFADLVYRKLMMRNHYGVDLKNWDPTLFKNLLSLYDYEGNVEDLGLTFSIDKVNSDSSTTRVDLIKNGSSIAVNNTNLQEYISKVIAHKLNSQGSQYQALVHGFTSMINKKHSRLFSLSELKTMMYGDNKYFELSDLKPYVNFIFSGTRSTYLENAFWKVLEEFTPQERTDFLFFVTSSKRPPVGGFKYLSPKLKIHFVNSIPLTNLPRAMTCVNTLYLSTFYDKNDMKEKIKTAISLNDGFFFG